MDESRTCLGVRVRVRAQNIPDTVSMDESPTCLGLRGRVIRVKTSLTSEQL